MEKLLGDSTEFSVENSEETTFNMKIDSELKKNFNIKCIANKTNMSKVLKDFIREYVSND